MSLYLDKTTSTADVLLSSSDNGSNYWMGHSVVLSSVVSVPYEYDGNY